MKIRIWWIINICWLIVFAVGAIFIWERRVDGAGIFQTPELKLASLAILGVALVFVGLCQALVLYFVRHYNKISHN